MNNIRQSCPAHMSDGRLYTDYRSGRYRDDIAAQGFSNSNDYRLYKQLNAVDEIQSGRDSVVSKECGQCDAKQQAPQVETYANLQDVDPDMLFNTINSKVIDTHKQQGDLSQTKPHVNPKSDHRLTDEEFHRGVQVQQPDMMLPGQMKAAEEADVPNMMAPGTMPAMYPVKYNTKQRETFVSMVSMGKSGFEGIICVALGVVLYQMVKRLI
jgi:hypothetical protein